MNNPSRILVLAPHTDDGELGCGATIAKMAAAGKEVFCYAFSTCARSLPEGLPADTLVTECKKANLVLGVNAENIRMLDFEVREMPLKRQEILEEMVSINKQLKPDLVFLPARNDIHQDHQVIHAEGFRAFKHSSILGYELPWNNARFQPNYFEVISEEDLSKKINALKMYGSQASKNYMKEDFTRSLAKVRGVQVNVEYAEAFEAYKIVKD